MAHHRQHTIGFLLSLAQEATNLTSGFTSFFSEEVTRPEDMDDATWNSVVNAYKHVQHETVRMINTVAIIIEMLQSPENDLKILDDVRAMLHSPQPQTANTLAADIFTINFYYEVFQTTLSLPASGGDRRGKIRRMWESIDAAIWHINDAIREEVYNDPAFG